MEDRPDTSLALTERGTILDKITEGDVNLGLRLLILNGGDVKKSTDALFEEGIVVSAEQLRYWRDVAFARRHTELRSEMAQDVGEEVAGRAMERAIQADDAEARYIELALEKSDAVSPDKLASSALALSKAKAENISKAQLLRDRPTAIKEVRDTAEILDVLKKQGVLASDPRDQIIDAEVVDE